MKSELLDSEIKLKEKDSLEIYFVCWKCNRKFPMITQNDIEEYNKHEC
jgi:hypothetical protein